MLLFCGGKDSIVLLRLAEKAFRPARFPFPLMHVDTGHNFPEVIEFRDRRVAELGERLIVASVQESIDSGRVVEETGPRASRNRLQTITLLDAIEEHGFDAAFGGARRDEERARAKERIFSLPRRLRPVGPAGASARSCGASTTGASARASTCACSRSRTGPSSTSGSTSPRSSLEVPSIYFAHEREVFRRDGMLLRGSRPTSSCWTARSRSARVGPLPHGRRHELHRRRRLDRRDAERRRRRDRRDEDHRARRDPRRRPRHARPRWRTARSRATSDVRRATNGNGNGRRALRARTACAWRRPARSTTASRR